MTLKLCNESATRFRWGGRYAPTDALLKTFVLSSVPKRMELEQFLELVADKYGLIIGSKESERYSKHLA